MKCQKKKKKKNDIQNKVSNGMKKELGSKLIDSNKCFKTQIRSYGDSTTNFHTKKYPKQSLIIFDGQKY